MTSSTTARQLFLRLMRWVGRKMSRRVPTQELTSLDASETMDYVTYFLAANRLLTLDLDPTTGSRWWKSYEALIREWVQLRVAGRVAMMCA